MAAPSADVVFARSVIVGIGALSQSGSAHALEIPEGVHAWMREASRSAIASVRPVRRSYAAGIGLETD